MRLLSRTALATGSALVLMLTAVPLANAQDGTSGGSSTPVDTSTPEKAEKAKQRAEQAKQQAEQRMKDAQEKAQKMREEAQKRKEERKEDRQGKLDEKKQTICKNREKNITGLMTRLNTRGQKHLDLISAIATRAQAYKTDKNLTVEGYETLLADVAAKKTAAQAAVDAVKAAQPEFKCDGTDPKGAADVFKELMKAQNEALKAYKQSVIKLLVAVKQSQGGTKTPAPAPSPSPTPEPSPSPEPAPNPAPTPGPTPPTNTEGGEQ